jgi:hypothetical protein
MITCETGHELDAVFWGLPCPWCLLERCEQLELRVAALEKAIAAKDEQQRDN